MRQPNPKTIDYLYSHFSETHSRADLIACWHNADRSWHLQPQYTGHNEPMEVTAARSIFVEAYATTDNPEFQQGLYAAIWLLIRSYTSLRLS